MHSVAFQDAISLPVETSLAIPYRRGIMTSARTNLGPLTTAFSYPPSCTVNVQQCTSCDLGWQGQTCGSHGFNTQGVEDNIDCWPPRDNANISTGVAFNGLGFYSPGISCPGGYQTARQATGSVSGGFTAQFSLLRSETAVGCCPTFVPTSY